MVISLPVIINIVQIERTYNVLCVSIIIRGCKHENTIQLLAVIPLHGPSDMSEDEDGLHRRKIRFYRYKFKVEGFL